jgi:hypothetical protein
MKKNYKKLNAIIIGVGKMAEVHFQSIKKLKINLLGIYDISKKNREKFKKKFKLKKIILIQNLNNFIKKNKIDLSIVSTTSDTHSKYAIQCAENKVKYIFVEKPMATSIHDCQKMISACKKNGSKLSINHNKIFSKEYKIIDKLIKSKKLGQFISMNVSAGNIGLAMNATHYIHFFLSITKSQIKKINGFFEDKKLFNPRGKIFLDKSGQIMLENSKKQYFNLNAYNQNGHGINTIYNFQYGNIFLNEIDNFGYLSKRKNKYLKFPSYKYGMPSSSFSFKYKRPSLKNMTTETLKNLINGKSSSSLKTAVKVVKILNASFKSNELKGLTCNLSNLNKKKKFPWA